MEFKRPDGSIGLGPVSAVVEKVCAACGTPKPLDDFHKAKGHALGRDNRCKECKRSARAKRYHADPKAAHAAVAAWRKKHPTDPVRRRVWEQRYTAKTKTPDADPGDLTADEWEEILDTYKVPPRDPSHLDDADRLAPPAHRCRYLCAYCGGRFRRVELSIDHVVPLSRGGRNTKGNVVPACGPCNSRKAHRERWPVVPSPHLTVDAIEPEAVDEDAFSFP